MALKRWENMHRDLHSTGYRCPALSALPCRGRCAETSLRPRSRRSHPVASLSGSRVHPANLNRVASSRPSPSLGATFRLLYEFVKSWSSVRILRSSPACTRLRNRVSFACICRSAWITYCFMLFINFVDSCGVMEPDGSSLMVFSIHSATCSGMRANISSSAPDASGKQSLGNVYIMPVMIR